MAASVAAALQAQGSAGRPPFVAIEQDGKEVASVNGEITLRRAPFVLVLRFPEMTVAKVHVSQLPGAYQAVRTNAAGEDLHPLGGGFAEADRNQDQSLYLSPPGRPAFHYWYFPEGTNHRFDTIKADGGVVIARRNVATFMTPDRNRHAVEQFPGDVVYLACRLVGSVSGVEVQRQGLKLTFTGKPVTAPATMAGASTGDAKDQEVLATVAGREITAGSFRRRYRQQLDHYKQAYGGSVTDQMLAQLGVDQQVMQTVIDEEAALVEAARLGINVTEAEVTASIHAMPAFQEKKRFVGEAKYREVLAAQTPPLRPEVFFEAARRGLVVDKLEAAVTKGLAAGPARTEAYQAHMQQAKSKMQIFINRDVLKRLAAEK